jgi:predicted dehydrogenase
MAIGKGSSMKVGIIGLGSMGMGHARSIRKFEFVREAVACDMNEAMRRGAEKEGFRCVSSVDALLKEKPFAVFVVTPPVTHEAIIRQCLEAGVHVFTEKPMTTEVREGRKLVELAARKKLNYQVGFELRYNGSTVGMRDVVDRGLIGTPRHMSLIQISGARLRGIVKNKNGGVFYEKLCHEIDLWRYFFGEPERVMAVSGPRVMNHYDCPDNVMSVMKFPGGEQGNITFLTTRAAHIGGTDDHGDRGHYYEMILTCTGGSVSFDYWTHTLEVVKFNHRDDYKSELIESIRIMERYKKPEYNTDDEDRDFLERTRAGKAPQFPAADAQISMEWVERAERSLVEGGRWVTKDE